MPQGVSVVAPGPNWMEPPSYTQGVVGPPPGLENREQRRGAREVELGDKAGFCGDRRPGLTVGAARGGERDGQRAGRRLP